MKFDKVTYTDPPNRIISISTLHCPTPLRENLPAMRPFVKIL